MKPDWQTGNHSRKYKSRHERGYGAPWVRIRKRALMRDKYLCQLCLPRITPAKDVDHIKPKSKGGTDDLSNLQSLCRACHVEKTRRENNRDLPIGLDGWPVG